MHPYLVISCLLASYALSGTTTKPATHGPLPNPYAKLEARIMADIKKGVVVGAAVAIIEPAGKPYIKAYGLRKKGESQAVDTSTVFQLGSTSKSITATLFALAEKQKRISLAAPIIKDGLLPNTQARHLLSHTSGFSRAGFNWQIEHGKSRVQLLDILKKKRQKTPGRFFDYHNVVFSLVEELLQDAFNMPFNDAMEHHLLSPLGMSKTSVGFSKFNLEPNRAWPHEKAKNGKIIVSANYSQRYHETVSSAGGINASIADMPQFLALQLGQLPHILSMEDLAPYHAAATEAKDAERWFKKRFKGEFKSHYGHGFRIVKRGDEEIIFHGGWVKGFTSLVAFSPKQRRGIAVLSNTENDFAFSTAMEFILETNDDQKEVKMAAKHK